jgi:hypothetical protein
MRSDRCIQILTAGLKAAHKIMFTERNSRKEEYPRDFDTMYAWLEDKVYDLYSAVALKDIGLISRTAGDVIVTASEIVEYAENRIAFEKKEDE